MDTWNRDQYVASRAFPATRLSSSPELPEWYDDFKAELAEELTKLIDTKTAAKSAYTTGKYTKAGLQSADVITSASQAGDAVANSPELARKVAQAVKAGGQWHGAIHILGDSLLVLKVGIAGYSVHTAPANEKVKTVSSESGHILGSLGGGFLGGAFGKYAGAGIGALVAGPVGGVVGAALGTIGFGLVGSFAGSEGGGVVGKELYVAIDECINKPPVPTFERIK
jgi:hypothetical protein